jgi:hypothetical protein
MDDSKDIASTLSVAEIITERPEIPLKSKPLGILALILSLICLVAGLGYAGAALYYVYYFAHQMSIGTPTGPIIGSTITHAINGLVLFGSSVAGLIGGIIRMRTQSYRYIYGLLWVHSYVGLLSLVLLLFDAICWVWLVNIVLSGVVVAGAIALLVPTMVIAWKLLNTMVAEDDMFELASTTQGSSLEIRIVQQDMKRTPLQIVLAVLCSLYIIGAAGYFGVSLWKVITVGRAYRVPADRGGYGFYISLYPVVAPTLASAVLHMINSLLLGAMCVVGIASCLVPGNKSKMGLLHAFAWGLGFNVVICAFLTLISGLNINPANGYQYNIFVKFSASMLGCLVLLNGILIVLTIIIIKNLRRRIAASVSVVMPVV